MLITSLIFIGGGGGKHTDVAAQKDRIDSRNPTAEEETFAVPLNQFSQLLKMMTIYTFLTLILYITVQNENIIPTNMCYDKIDIFIQNLQEIGASTLSKM